MSDQELRAAYEGSQPKGLYGALDTGVAKGVAGLIGLPQAVGEIGARGIQYLEGKAGIQSRPELYETGMRLPTTQGATEAIQKDFYNGQPLYEPQTRAERYVERAGEFLPGAAAGPGGLIRKAVGYAAAPAGAFEFTREQTQETPAESWAPTAAAVATGGLAGVGGRPSTAAQAIRNNLPTGVAPQMVDQAGNLIRDAAAQGVTLSWPETLSQVAGRPVLSNTMRHLEASGPTEGRMADFYAPRAQQIEAAGRGAMDNFGPAAANPSMIGPQAGQAAEETLNGIRGAINQATRPSYDAARQSLVPQNVHAAMMQDPLFARTLNEIRTNPELSGPYRGLSDRSSIVYDGVKKTLEQRAQNLRNPVNPNASQEAAANVGSMAGDARTIAVAADRNAMGLAPGQRGVGNLERALAEQARLREAYLEPLQRGPIGRMGSKDTTTRNAIEALFGSESQVAGSANEVATAVRGLVQRNPNVAGQLVRAHAESVFNEATTALQGGANQAGGAKFRAMLVGNPQQRANFEAAVTALPHGQQRLDGFNRFLDIMEATGTRQNIGSKTAYNQEFLKQASSSGVVGEVAKGAANPVSRFTQGLVERYERYRLGRNLNELADILTNPAARGQLRAISQMPTSALNSPRALAVAWRLASLTRPGP